MSLRIASGLSTDRDPVAATEAASRAALAGLRGGRCDLAFAFVSAAFAEHAVEIAKALHGLLEPGALLGATGVAIVGGAREVEGTPAVSVWAAHLPGTSLLTFAAEYTETSDGPVFVGWPEEVPGGASVLILADPFTFPADLLLSRVNDERAGLTVIGGMASGAGAPGGHRLWVDTEVRNGGAVGVVIHGRAKVRALVSQGCRPIGAPATVTKSDRNIIEELAGRTPIELLRHTFARATPEERVLMQSGLHIGRVVDEYKTEFRRGDFLIRNVMGADEGSGAMAVGDVVPVGETVQFHVRDAASADEDLRVLLATAPLPDGALLFTCNGRGARLFGVPDHDARAVSEAFGSTALAGMFCNGEIGPIGGRSFLHGFTASLALFYED